MVVKLSVKWLLGFFNGRLSNWYSNKFDYSQLVARRQVSRSGILKKKKKRLFKVWGRGFSMVSLFLKQVEVNGVLFFFFNRNCPLIRKWLMLCTSGIPNVFTILASMKSQIPETHTHTDTYLCVYKHTYIKPPAFIPCAWRAVSQ